MNEETFDFVTGLWDRKTAMNYLETNTCSDLNLSIAICNVDFFINIDSKVGRSEGDKILKRMGLFFSSFNEFITGRYYGDSFILIFENMNNEEQVLSFVDELRKQFRRQRFIDEESIYAKAPISASFGIALRVGRKKKLR